MDCRVKPGNDGYLFFVMAGLVPATHVFRLGKRRKTWMPGIKPGMTVVSVEASRDDTKTV
jgi:hypothetical protein